MNLEQTVSETSMPAPEERRLVEALRAGDEAAFAELVRRYGGAMLRVARLYVRSRAVAEEVVQETWLAVLDGVGRFEARSTLKTWIFRILTNKAKTRAQRESRSVPFSALEAEGEREPAVDADRFRPAGDRWAGHWASAPRRWEVEPEGRLLAGETITVVEQAIAGLPDAQRTVISLRDVEGWGSNEVCDLLGLTEINQRVLLHRARAKVRRALEEHLG